MNPTPKLPKVLWVLEINGCQVSFSNRRSARKYHRRHLESNGPFAYRLDKSTRG